jgi:hypothetical protein
LAVVLKLVIGIVAASLTLAVGFKIKDNQSAQIKQAAKMFALASSQKWCFKVVAKTKPAVGARARLPRQKWLKAAIGSLAGLFVEGSETEPQSGSHFLVSG